MSLPFRVALVLTAALCVGCTIQLPNDDGPPPSASSETVEFSRMDPPMQRRVVEWDWVPVYMAGGERDDTLFGLPRELAASTDGVYVLDPGSHALFAFDRTATLRWRAGRKGNGPGEFARPTDLALLPDGGVAVLDPDNARIEEFAPSGTRTGAVAAPQLVNANEFCTTTDGRYHVRQPRWDAFLTTVDRTGAILATTAFPWKHPQGAPSFLRDAHLARGVPGSDCWAATLHGFGLFHFQPGGTHATHPFVEPIDPPVFEQRPGTNGGVGTFMVGGTTAARAPIRTGDTLLVPFDGSSRQSIMDLYDRSGAYMESWRVPGYERIAYADRRLYVLIGAMDSPRLLVYVPAADTAPLMREHRARRSGGAGASR